MKTALFLLLSLIALPGFSQSKKSINTDLWQKQKQLVRQNDSLNEVITDKFKLLKRQWSDAYIAGRNLSDYRMNFNTFKRDIASVQKTLLELGVDPNSLVPQEELDAIYAKYDDIDYQKDLEENGLRIQAVTIQALEDISAEKLKLQNERLAQKNQEYITVIDTNLQVIRNMEFLASKCADVTQKMETTYGNLARNGQLLKKKYELLRSKCTELETKKELAEIAAENAREEREEKMLLEKTSSKNTKNKTKVKTVPFVPPVITDEAYPPPVMESNENAGFDADIAPPPPPPVKIDERTSQEPVIVDILEEPASFPGGREALLKYLQEQIVYPQVAKDAGISGKVYLKFVVSAQGTISNVKVMRGIPDCPECDQEAVRVVRRMPKWIPGKSNGKVVNSFYNLPIVFK